MILRPGGSYADYYPNVPAARIATLRTCLASVPRRLPLQHEWVRKIPAARLRRGPTDPPPLLLAPVGYHHVHNRYTRQHAFPSLYLSDGVTTAGHEVSGGPRRGAPDKLGVPERSWLELVVEASLPDVIDLTDPGTLGQLQVEEAELTGLPDPLIVDALGRHPEYEFPQCLGELANELEIGALQYPSARLTGGVNVVILTDHLARTGGAVSWTEPVSGVMQQLP
ncbi:MAG TPA: RES domain-containing protein [Gemmatimonadales bacterium]